MSHNRLTPAVAHWNMRYVKSPAAYLNPYIAKYKQMDEQTQNNAFRQPCGAQ